MAKLDEMQSFRLPSRRLALSGGGAVLATFVTALRLDEARAQTTKSGSSPSPEVGSANYLTAVLDYHVALFENQPSLATAFGFHAENAKQLGFPDSLAAIDAKLENGSEAEYKKLITHCKASIAKFSQLLQQTKLDPKDRHDLETLIGRISGDLLDTETIKTWSRDPGIYPAIALVAVQGMFKWRDKSKSPMDYKSRKRQEDASRRHLKNVVSRLQAIPVLLNNGKINVAIANRPLKDQPPKVMIEQAIIGLVDQIAYFKNELPKAFPGIGHDELAELLAANAVVVEKLDAYKTQLTDLQSISTGPENFAIGRAALVEHFKYYELLDVDPDALLARANRLLDSEAADYTATAKKIADKIGGPLASETDPKKLVLDINDWVKANLHPARDELLPTVQRQLLLLKQFLIEKKIVRIPVAYGIGTLRPLPTDAEVTAEGAYALESPGALEILDFPRATYAVDVPDLKMAGRELRTSSRRPKPTAFSSPRHMRYGRVISCNI